ncbi:MAG: hypothetical protein ACREPY_03480 [Rhodanobacteraceae bacterium]
MRWPSGKSIAIGTLAFVAGFVVAVALAAGFVTWVYTSNQSGRQNGVIDPLVSTVELLDVEDKQPAHLTRVIAGNARDSSLTAAVQFDRLTKTNQQIVLRLFARLNRSTTLRADEAPFADTVRLARLMVLCTHQSAAPGWLTVSKDSGATTPVPDWVLNPHAKPVMPAAGSIYGAMQQSPAVLAAERKQWGKLRKWVIANQACIAKQQATP